MQTIVLNQEHTIRNTPSWVVGQQRATSGRAHSMLYLLVSQARMHVRSAWVHFSWQHRVRKRSTDVEIHVRMQAEADAGELVKPSATKGAPLHPASQTSSQDGEPLIHLDLTCKHDGVSAEIAVTPTESEDEHTGARPILILSACLNESL